MFCAAREEELNLWHRKPEFIISLNVNVESSSWRIPLRNYIRKEADIKSVAAAAVCLNPCIHMQLISF